MSKKEEIHKLISCIDLTSLNDDDKEASIFQLVEKAEKGINGYHPAGICAYPKFATFIRKHSTLPIIAVAGDFPEGKASTEKKIQQLNQLIDLPIQEFDVVVNRQDIIEKHWEKIRNEIARSKKIIGKRVLKVIIESGELEANQIREVCQTVLEGNADFIKTSTGKTTIGATEEAATIICQEINIWHRKKNKKVGFKASGGIRSFDEAQKYASIVKNELGTTWLQPELFRIGASSLFDQLKKELDVV